MWPDARQPDPIAIALLWSVMGGALGGALVHSAPAILQNVADLATGTLLTFDQLYALLVVGPLLIGFYSLVVVIPCTLLFGLPSALALRHFALRKWPALALIGASAGCAEVGALWLISGDVPPLAGLLFATPFAASAAIILWWRLAPPA